MAADVRLSDGPFDPAREIAAFAAAHPQAGGIASFLGQVRCDEGVEALELRHYAPLTLDGKTKTYYRYTTKDGQTDYYDEQGRSAQKALLKTPGTLRRYRFALKDVPLP